MSRGFFENFFLAGHLIAEDSSAKNHGTYVYTHTLALSYTHHCGGGHVYRANNSGF